MQTLTEIKSLLESHGLRPRHALGQNFLCDHNLIRKLVDASGVKSGDRVLEVGPGTGTLTEELLARGCRVIACELDSMLASLLRVRLADHLKTGAFTLIEGDCLAGKHALSPEVANALGAGPAAEKSEKSIEVAGPTSMARGEPFRLVANLPYGAASPLMAILAMDWPRCLGQYVTIQKEVAQRIRAQPGSKDYGELGVILQATHEVKKIATLPPECFWPRPEVTSEMVGLERLTPEKARTKDAHRLAAMCRRLFTQRRKQIGTTLGRDFAFPEGIGGRMRPEELSVEQIEALSVNSAER